MKTVIKIIIAATLSIACKPSRASKVKSISSKGYMVSLNEIKLKIDKKQHLKDLMDNADYYYKSQSSSNHNSLFANDLAHFQKNEMDHHKEVWQNS